MLGHLHMFRDLHAVSREQPSRPAKVVQREVRRQLRLEARRHLTDPPQPSRRPAA